MRSTRLRCAHRQLADLTAARTSSRRPFAFDAFSVIANGFPCTSGQAFRPTRRVPSCSRVFQRPDLALRAWPEEKPRGVFMPIGGALRARPNRWFVFPSSVCGTTAESFGDDFSSLIAKVIRDQSIGIKRQGLSSHALALGNGHTAYEPLELRNHAAAH